jgi:small-conductance mechanosensitive channel
MADLGSLGQRAQELLWWLPPWAIDLVLLAVALAIAYLVHRILYRVAVRIVGSAELFWRALVVRIEGPARLGLMIVALAAAVALAPLSDEGRVIVHRILLLSFIVLLGWVTLTALEIWVTIYLRRYTTVAADDPLARKHITQTRILRRVAATLIVMITASAGLMSFDAVRQYGVSILASAGAAGIVVALALQPVLKNLFAGIQLAVTQPIRIGDAVIVENEWGWVEEITGTYVVIKVWDWRRLVVPLSYFLDKPFQNWTLQGTDLIGSVFLWVDYTVPVAHVRAKLEEIVRTTKLWSGEVVNLQVVESNEQAVQLRALVSARTSEQAWDLRCEVREKLIVFLQQTYPTALPKQRAELVELDRPRSAA